ncbi:hypothetical protein [Chondrinema litorale]|uniref:hypothetical protein n=1 Tax=Chondrinema litorale TaxID=2994555 RepID=UPI0025439A74|nr:hypothetical protein [Chondrinema litorale]UZS00226.1 hypothetical protein OQ292_40410 [Chondrinema litorale]
MITLGIPIILLTTIWSAFSVVLKALELMTNRKDRFLGLIKNEVGNHHPTVNVRNRFFLDWLPIWMGTGSFLVLFAIIIFCVPSFVDSGFKENLSDELTSSIEFLCILIAAIPFFGAIAFLLGGLLDIRLIIKIMKEEKKVSQSKDQTNTFYLNKLRKFNHLENVCFSWFNLLDDCVRTIHFNSEKNNFKLSGYYPLDKRKPCNGKYISIDININNQDEDIKQEMIFHVITDYLTIYDRVVKTYQSP